ncbi:MAG: hypothetical protein R8G66_05980 [Cytophagales bacterium]|nr:hypothetical protein [Cytophagales bacterium]
MNKKTATSLLIMLMGVTIAAPEESKPGFEKGFLEEFSEFLIISINVIN